MPNEDDQCTLQIDDVPEKPRASSRAQGGAEKSCELQHWACQNQNGVNGDSDGDNNPRNQPKVLPNTSARVHGWVEQQVEEDLPAGARHSTQAGRSRAQSECTASSRRQRRPTELAKETGDHVSTSR